jgi:hypothetical protein
MVIITNSSIVKRKSYRIKKKELKKQHIEDTQINKLEVLADT